MGILIESIKSRLLKVHKSLEILDRKAAMMGLTDEESKRRDKLYHEYTVLQNEIVDIALEENLINPFMSLRGKEYLLKIQEIIPWNGRLLLYPEDRLAIRKKIRKMNDDEILKLAYLVEDLQWETMKILEKACEDDDITEYMKDVGKYIKLGAEEPLLNTVAYINLRFISISEVCDFELPELAFDYEEEDDE